MKNRFQWSSVFDWCKTHGCVGAKARNQKMPFHNEAEGILALSNKKANEEWWRETGLNSVMHLLTGPGTGLRFNVTRHNAIS